MTLSLDRTCTILLRECAHIRRGEEVLVLADDLQAPELSTAILKAASKLNAHTVTIVYPAHPPYREPPRTVLHAMKSSDVIIACATRPIAGGVMDEALKAGARILSMFRITIDALCRTVPIDYHALRKEMKRIKKILDGSRAIGITSPRGTNLNVKMANRPTLLAFGSVRKSGEIDYIPAGAIGVAPLEGTAEGRVVVDGTILGFGRCLKPVTFEIEKGRVKKVSGGDNWKGLRELLRRDENATMLCEIGLGVNPKAKLVGGPEDERVRGSVHVGLGENRNFGGTLASASHLDGTMLHATLSVDGKDLVRDGRLLI
ncbi:MAG: aminopeptidase [Thermodesulfobacteriota bacterium]